MMVDTKNLLFYWRLSPDGRMLFGGRRSLAPTTVADARDFLYSSMVRIHPQLAGTAVECAWGGHVAMTFDRMPHFGRVPDRAGGRRAASPPGCNGSGVALNSWMGTRAADVLLGGDPPALAEIGFPAVPLHRFRRAYLPVVGRWFTWQDAPLRSTLLRRSGLPCERSVWRPQRAAVRAVGEGAVLVGAAGGQEREQLEPVAAGVEVEVGDQHGGRGHAGPAPGSARRDR